MELWVTLLQDVGKLSFAFPCPVNRVIHDGMGSDALFHDVALNVLSDYWVISKSEGYTLIVLL